MQPRTVFAGSLTKCLCFLVGSVGLYAGSHQPGFARAESSEPSRSPNEADLRRQLDFWVGDWVVLNSAGQKMGTNRIEKAENGFAIVEHWSSALGGTGRSINYVDPTEKEWKQVWVSSRGSVVTYSGKFVDGEMRFTGRSCAADGQCQLSRASLRPLADGRVRQLIERSGDNGKTWSPAFEGYYSKSRGDPEPPARSK